ncbi:MAG: hypothetical protein RI842_02115 [Schleiferiaceae bacterium]|nr:hypothetical protein [Schleiferiaceae bacterium]MDR9441487.1 hypothetical protein [Schleiferiaceae bacterium]
MMMVKLFSTFIVVLVFSTGSLIAQDLIVTNEGDTINAKITEVSSGSIYFRFKHKEDIRNTLIPLRRIKRYQFGYFKNNEVPLGEVKKKNGYSDFRIAISGGYSYRTAKVSPIVPIVFEDYVRGLKSGYHIGADFTYYSTEPLGFGLKCYLFNASNYKANVSFEDEYGNQMRGDMSDDLTITFIGPTLSTRLLSHDKSGAFLMNLSVGYMGYTNDAFLIYPMEITGNTLGLSFDLGYDFELVDNLTLGFQLSYLTGTLTDYRLKYGSTIEYIKLNKDEYESLNRIDLSFGLRFGI